MFTKEKIYALSYVERFCNDENMFYTILESQPEVYVKGAEEDLYNYTHDENGEEIEEQIQELSGLYIYDVICDINEGYYTSMYIDEYIDKVVIPTYENEFSLRDFYNDFCGLQPEEIAYAFDNENYVSTTCNLVVYKA